jgi:hypothetical protein
MLSSDQTLSAGRLIDLCCEATGLLTGCMALRNRGCCGAATEY